MSDPVIAAIITTSGALLVAVIVHWRKTHSKSQPEPDSQRPSPTAIPISETPKGQRRVTDFSHKQISDTIDAVPPLQRDSIEASFVGVYVSWRGKLNSASQHGDETWVSLNNICDGGGLIHCTAASHDCVALLIAPEDTEIIVKGKIKAVRKHAGRLEDCKFEILQKTVA